MAQGLARRHFLIIGLSLAVVVWASSSPARAQRVDAAMKKLMAASGLFQRGMYAMAAEEYADFLTDYPGHAQATDARYGLAICLYRQNEYAKSVTEVQKVLKDARFKQRDEALAVLGHCQLVTGANAEALAALDELLAKHADSRHAEVAWLNRAQALYLLARHGEALKACEAFLAKHPNSSKLAAAKYFQALSQGALGKHGEAEKALTKLLADYPNSPYELDGSLLLGQALENQGKLNEAAGQYRKFCKSAPRGRQSEGHYSLGVVHYKAGNYKESIAALSAVVTLHAKSRYAAPARLQLGLAQLAAGKAAEARKTLTEVVKGDKGRGNTAKYWLAQCDLAEKKYDAARAALDALAALKPPVPNIQAITFDRAVCAMSTNKHDQAAKEFQAFRQKYPKSDRFAEAAYRLAFCLHKLDRYDESLKLCAQAGVKDAAMKRAVAELAAENLFLMRKYPEAKKALTALLGAAKSADEKVRLRFRLGQCAYFAEDYTRAIEHLSAVARSSQAARSDELGQSVFLLGDAQLQTGWHAAAAKTLAGYLAKAKRNREEAQFKLGLAQLRSGAAASASKSFAAVMNSKAASPWVIRATFEYGQLAYKDRKPAEAAAALKKVLAAAGPAELQAPASYLLAWIDFDARKYAPAADGFGRMIKQWPKHALAAEAAFQRGVALREAGKSAEALAALRKFVADHPADKHAGEARRLIGACLSKLGKHGDAVKALSALAADKKTCTAGVLYELAWAQRATKDHKGASASYRRLLAEFGGDKLAVNARTELGELLYQLKQYAEAARLLEQVAAAKAGAKLQAVARYRLGWCYNKLAQPAKAAAAFSDFAARYAADELAPSAMYHGAMAYIELRKFPDAEALLTKLLAGRAAGKLADAAYLKLGEVQNTLASHTKAIATFEAFLKRSPKSKYAHLAHFGTGWANEKLKKYDQARRSYEKVIAATNDPYAARAQFQIGETYFAEKKYRQAAKALLAVTAVYAYPKWSAKALYEAGQVFEAMKDLRNAKRQYGDCVKLYKDTNEGILSAKRLAALSSGS